MKSKLFAHSGALFSILVWGSTFVASKMLLEVTSVSKLLFTRFVIGYVILLLLEHKQLFLNLKDEFGMFLFGLIGVTVYNFCETTALKYTYAANVSILVTLAPLITIYISHLIHKEKVHSKMLIGSFIALIGAIFVIFNGNIELHLSFKGDALAFLAAFCWAFYSLLLRHFSNKYDDMLITRKLLFYGMITLFPLALSDHTAWSIHMFKGYHLLQLLFLGGLGSGLCYITWNKSNVILGIHAANAYVYAIPFVTLFAANFFLHEPITLMSIIGCIFILIGVILNEL